jgi:assimilatory nitrate reductase catalytic subunit
MGGRETGSLSNCCPAIVANPNTAPKWRLLGCRAATGNPGLSAIELFEQVRSGKIKALWIACTNPAQSLPDQSAVRAALQACPFVVLQEAFHTTETAAFADLLLTRCQLGREGRLGDQLRTAYFPRAQSHLPPGEARRTGRSPVDFAQRLENICAPDNPACLPEPRRSSSMNTNN